MASGATFLPFFVLANNGNPANRSDVFARPPGAGVAADLVSLPSALVEERGLALRPAPRTGLRRSY